MMRPLAMIVALLLALQAAGAAAAELGVKLTDRELAEQRGGLMTPIGLDIGFSASVRTYVDGALVLETRLVWTDQGPVRETLGDISAMGPAPEGPGFVLPSLDGGSTTVLQDLADGRIASVILNTASNRNIRQDTDVTIYLPQLAQLQAQVAAQEIAARLQGALGLALQGGARAGH